MEKENLNKQIKTVGMISNKKHQWSYVLDRGGAARHRTLLFGDGVQRWLNNGEKNHNIGSYWKHAETE